MRHGEVSYFDENGRPRDPRQVPLTATGRGQAQAAADSLVAVPFDRAICSGMPRARETAELVLAGRDLAVEDCDALREIRGGRLRDVPDGELFQSLARGYARAAEPDARFIGGEPFAEFAGRVLQVWRQLLADPQWSCLLLVAHDAVNRAILGEVSGAGLAGWPCFEQDLACINILECAQDDAPILRLCNFTPYAAAKQGLHMTSMERVFLHYRPVPSSC
jgi:broad specificity phosphatase PhoE